MSNYKTFTSWVRNFFSFIKLVGWDFSGLRLFYCFVSFIFNSFVWNSGLLIKALNTYSTVCAFSCLPRLYDLIFYSPFSKMKVTMVFLALLALIIGFCQCRRLSLRSASDENTVCQGRLDLSKFSKVNQVCEECYSLFREVGVYELCR